jgi:copper chaperone
MTSSEYLVSAMTCGHCVAAIQAVVGQIPGASGVDASARTGRLVVNTSVRRPSCPR